MALVIPAKRGVSMQLLGELAREIPSAPLFAPRKKSESASLSQTLPQKPAPTD
jgi:hypothetical protein